MKNISVKKGDTVLTLTDSNLSYRVEKMALSG